ncbi:bacterial regulatory s, luxR family protein [Burkholderia ambifaria AMMD]|jgi:DNA-binding CsgD family transcriptional regulator|uniref:Transcriptional regulator, LuxR family n=1 Tax=Burkholderia ambifaria (strain ATCC BAA-244 / DSM 16087 / CCUG 44356 / LMG 19182 / AMMD) TaxID=339670 RepID=Q0BF94_BURCM|nr:helix-turn-helix transcriptional regulator [Burkholderia ambifaria]ABI87179.1 transcriptional regulator, LuxR family [Burkholderia ambifaria AMMD]AJY23115.1 bacterial regulatory s, luxR family protein [Burkholderia ambifaria AMMD]MBR7928668.1 helix-turn-helix transcriptional regulator [Burkholderia ambifaria]PEH65599.1 helix-turn-helix transcriptional regulator [Burkholderia ambifaria]QQC05913.1 helix-turn-helix transcriptional regulator [Burkholderia ambifaria]
MTCFVDQLKSIFDHYPGLWGCKDDTSRFIHVNDAFAKVVGIDDARELGGKSASDLPCRSSSCAAQFHAQDREVCETGRAIKVLDIHPYAEDVWMAFVFTKIPLVDRNEQIVGTIFHAEALSQIDMITLGRVIGDSYAGKKIGSLVQQGSYRIGSPKDALDLTERERQVLFFLARNKMAKDIANILELSVRTIEQYIDNLRCKFSASSKNELIELAASAGYCNRIPQSLLRNQLSIVIERGEPRTRAEACGPADDPRSSQCTRASYELSFE